ncbi:MAG: hypothetical protein ACRD2T_12700 [Thermoanaerobaculia bacterium]
MSSVIPNGPGGLIKTDVLNPLMRSGALKPEGRQLLKGLRRNLGNAESVHSLQHVRDQIFFHSPRQGGTLVGFAGPVGGEGTSCLSVLLGLALGELKRKRVVFVDGRLERRSFSVYAEIFGLAKSAQNLQNGAGYFQCYSTRSQSLFFLTPGATVEALELYSSGQVSKLVAELRENFDYILFDMPPLLRSSEARMLIPHLDLFFLVCEARKTTVCDIVKAHRVVAEVGGSVKGVVLNRQRVPLWASFFGKDAFV